MSWGVIRGEEVVWDQVEGDLCRGLRQAVMAGPHQGSRHLEVAVAELEPGGSVEGHLHPFEESFYVLSGEALVTIADRSYRLEADHFGFVPVGTAHSWRNAGSGSVRWLRTRSPQPRRLHQASGSYAVKEMSPPETGRPIEIGDRGRRFVGAYDPSLLPPAGAIQMKGFRSARPTNVGLYMLVDEVVGAVHHTLFMVRFEPTGPAMTLGGQHFHPFEETYYIIEGEAVAHLEEESIPVKPGDLVFAGVNALHGFSNTTSQPVRWIEAQAPSPPPSGAFFFASDWS